MEIIAALPSFGNVLFTLAAFVVALSVIVAVHEFGHYIVGRWCGIHAETFSLGFGPVLAARRDRRGTKWQFAALPFGGYVKFLGDSDAASGRDGTEMAGLTAAERRRTMHGAPLWARSATVAAGPVFNFVLSFLVFSALLFARGVPVEPPEIGELKPLPAATGALQEGDRILAIEGRETPDLAAFYQVIEELPVRSGLDYRVRRDESERVVPGPYPFPPLIEGVQPNSAAMEVGLRTGDLILAIDGAPVTAFSGLKEKVEASGGTPLRLEVWREGETLEVTLAPRRQAVPDGTGGFETRWLIGMTGGLFFSPATAAPGPIEAASYGVAQTGFIVSSSLSGLWNMLTGAISSCNLSGPIGIAETSGAVASQGAASFIWFIAVLSTAVGLLNLFPVPVLDGGHLVFHAYEALAGRPPSERALQVMMGAGFALILALMAFALTNDLLCP